MFSPASKNTGAEKHIPTFNSAQLIFLKFFIDILFLHFFYKRKYFCQNRVRFLRNIIADAAERKPICNLIILGYRYTVLPRNAYKPLGKFSFCGRRNIRSISSFRISECNSLIHASPFAEESGTSAAQKPEKSSESVYATGMELPASAHESIICSSMPLYNFCCSQGTGGIMRYTTFSNLSFMKYNIKTYFLRLV